jgi:hypothetical protein
MIADDREGPIETALKMLTAPVWVPIYLAYVGCCKLAEAWARRKATPGTAELNAPSVGQAGKGHAPALSPKQSRAFETANAHFEQSHMQSHAPDQQQGAGVHKGWGPAARIASAKARNAKTLPYGGDPTQAPD